MATESTAPVRTARNVLSDQSARSMSLALVLHRVRRLPGTSLIAFVSRLCRAWAHRPWLLRALFWGSSSCFYLLWEILLSNISLAWLVIQPKPKLDPGIIGVPLRLNSGLEITMLASAITLDARHAQRRPGPGR